MKKYSAMMTGWVLAAIIAVVWVSAAAYSSSPGIRTYVRFPDQKWPVYRNFTVGMDVSFPPGWSYEEGSGDTAFSLEEPAVQSKYRDPSNLVIKVMGVYKGPEKDLMQSQKELVNALKAPVQKKSSFNPSGTCSVLYEGEVAINDVRGYMFDCAVPGTGMAKEIEHISLCITSPENITLYIAVFHPRDGHYGDIYLRILSSITFFDRTKAPRQ